MTDKRNAFDDLFDTLDAGLKGVENALKTVSTDDESDDVPDPMIVSHSRDSSRIIDIPDADKSAECLSRIADVVKSCLSSGKYASLTLEFRSELTLDLVLAIGKVL